jgi:hypothetical protein
MGTRKNEKKATTTQSGTTDYTGAFKSYDITPEEQELKEWAPDRTLADAERNRLGLQNKQFLASLRRPQYVTTGARTTGTGTTTEQRPSNLLASIISGGLGLAGAFA